jgi:uncharacterized membrane protein YeaQ/YmgE (transglycosylase-associated protein family)
MQTNATSLGWGICLAFGIVGALGGYAIVSELPGMVIGGIGGGLIAMSILKGYLGTGFLITIITTSSGAAVAYLIRGIAKDSLYGAVAGSILGACIHIWRTMWTRKE